MADINKATKEKAKVKKVVKTTVKSMPNKAVSKVSKPAVKAEKSEIKVSKTPKTIEKAVAVKVTVYDSDGSSKGSITLPSEIFGIQPNRTLIAQAVRVYLANQRQGNASTKTRSEVVGSTRKIYRQKGTGRARHGALKAPLFVGGGVAHGPRPHSFSMDFPKKMRQKALISALSQKAQEGYIKVIDGEFSGKTKDFSKMLKAMDLVVKGKTAKTLVVIDENANAIRASRNIKNLAIENASTLSTYGVMANKNVIFLKNSITKITDRINKN